MAKFLAIWWDADDIAPPDVIVEARDAEYVGNWHTLLPSAWQLQRKARKKDAAEQSARKTERAEYERLKKKFEVK